jgi:hypothetical protein
MIVPPMLPKYVSAAFGSLDLPDISVHPTAPSVNHKFKPKNQTDDIFLVPAGRPHLAPIARPVLLSRRSPFCPARILVAYVERTLLARLQTG